MLRRVRRRDWGQGLAEVAVVCSIMTSMAGGGMGAAWGVLSSARQSVVRSNLRQIYLAIQMFADDNDGLPRADFYPNIKRDPNAVRNSPRSIVRILGNGIPSSFWVSPAAPEQFQKAGLTFVWNASVGGRHPDQLDPRTWLLMDMNAAAYVVPELVKRPEGGYLVLYADGSVRYEHQPPLVVKPQDKAKLVAAVKRGGGGGGGGADGGAGGGEADVNVPEDPDAKVREKEEAAREANPDEDDAVDE